MKQSVRDISHKLFLVAGMVLLSLHADVIHTQGVSSFIGDRNNIGIFGGPAEDLSFSASNYRVFAATETPFTLFISSDTCSTWVPAFPVDSLDYNLSERGWGGGARRVLTNRYDAVQVFTGATLNDYSASVISYNNGNTFFTAADDDLLMYETGDSYPVTAIELTDHWAYTALGPYLVKRTESTPYGIGIMDFKVDTIPIVSSGSWISSIAASNDISGFPLCLVINDNTQNGRLLKSFGGIVFELGGLPVNSVFVNVFAHPVQLSGDTLFVTALDTLTTEYSVHRSYNGGFSWTDISPTAAPIVEPLSDVDYSDSWQTQLPLSGGVRISFKGGIYSDDLGDTWQSPGAGILNYGIASHPIDVNLVLGSNNTGVAKSTTGPSGGFVKTPNEGFAGLEVWDFSTSQGDYYIATSGGLAYTKEYFNQTITGYEQWNPPYGQFPVPGVGGENGITAVAVDPQDANHIICGDDNGFYLSFSGFGDFTQVTPSGWNNGLHLDNYVTDILFIDSYTIVAVTGQKFKPLPGAPPMSIGNIWLSVDGGVTWAVKTPFFPEEFQMGNCLAFESLPSPVVYAGTGFSQNGIVQVSGGLWASFDYGDNWNYVGAGPVAGGESQPVYDIDIEPGNSSNLFLAARSAVALSNDGGNSFFIADVPGNYGRFTSCLLSPSTADSLTITAGSSIFKYSVSLDDADLVFRGLPGESFISSGFGSTLGGSNTGASRIEEAPTYLLDLKFFTEGAFNGTDLNSTLNSLGYLPLTQPFNQPPWNYNGTESVSSIPSTDIVDWVLLELRKTDGDATLATEETRFDRKAVFLKSDGSLVDDDGTTFPRTSIILAESKGNEKILGVVYTPGHVGAKTADSLTQSSKSNTFIYDFTTGPDQVYGGATAHKELVTGVWGLISGDANHDSQVDNSDKNDVWLIENGNSGYYSSDFNRDGTVDLVDLNSYWKPNAGSGAQIE